MRNACHQQDCLFSDLGGYLSRDHITMPQPQYLGAKYKLLPWIMQFAEVNEGSIILDGFGGSQSVAFAMKKAGGMVYTCDFLNCCHQVGMALIENSGEVLTEGDVDMLFTVTPLCGSTMMNFKDIFFAEEECAFLDSFRHNVNKLFTTHKRAMALAVMCRTLTRKTTMGHFAHLQAMTYAADPVRVRRNPNIARSAQEVFMQLLPQYNAAIFDNNYPCKSIHANILDALTKLSEQVDLVYYDPPYCGSHADYQAFYHLLETFTENWQDKQLINKNRRYYPPRYSGFDRMSDVEKSFRRLFELSDEIPRWLISYNDRSVPSLEILVQMASRHKKVRVEEKIYERSRGGKGSVQGSKEYLLICE